MGLSDMRLSDELKSSLLPSNFKHKKRKTYTFLEL